MSLAALPSGPGPRDNAAALRTAQGIATDARDKATARLQWAMELHADGLWPTPLALESLIQARALEETLWALQCQLLRDRLAELGEQ